MRVRRNAFGRLGADKRCSDRELAKHCGSCGFFRDGRKARDNKDAWMACELAQLPKLEKAKALLAQCTQVEQAKNMHDIAEAARQYARMNGLGLDAQNLATEIKIRAGRRAGELLKQVERRHRGGANALDCLCRQVHRITEGSLGAQDGERLDVARRQGMKTKKRRFR